MCKVLIVVFLGLLLPSGAQAYKHHAMKRRIIVHHQASWQPNPITVAFAIAARYWHEQPCNSDITIKVESIPPNSASWTRHEDPRNVSMWASWDRGTPNENNEHAPLPFTNCIIGINSLRWTSQELMGYTAWPEFAISMIHEFHHLMGYGDLFAPQDTGSIDYIEPSANITLTGEYAPGWG